MLHNGATVPPAQWRYELDYSTPSDGFFLREAPELAPDLIGCLLARESSSGRMSGIIVETEAYTEDDPASHSFGGRTGRSRHMFEAGGTVYVYFIYGMHHCLNVVCGPEGSGQAVLVRAVVPLEGVDLMRANRPGRPDHELCSGPGKLCSAFGITGSHGGSVFGEGELSILVPDICGAPEIVTSRRIGITRGRERRWRFRPADPGQVSR